MGTTLDTTEDRRDFDIEQREAIAKCLAYYLLMTDEQKEEARKTKPGTVIFSVRDEDGV